MVIFKELTDKLHFFQSVFQIKILLKTHHQPTDSQEILACFCPHIIFAYCCKKLVFLPQLSIMDTGQARKNLATRLK